MSQGKPLPKRLVTLISATNSAVFFTTTETLSLSLSSSFSVFSVLEKFNVETLGTHKTTQMDQNSCMYGITDMGFFFLNNNPDNKLTVSWIGKLSRMFVHQFYQLTLFSHYRFSSFPREFCLEILLQFACYQELDPTYTTLVAAVSDQKEEFIQFQKKTQKNIYSFSSSNIS